MVLTLIIFDVEGAYNGVNATVLTSRLRKRRIPEVAVQWIEDFCSERKACIAGEEKDGFLITF